MKKLFLLLISLQVSLHILAQNSGFTPQNLEKNIQQVIEKAYQASVYITPFDSIAKKAVGGSFSGVVIDPAGHILSAAHAIKPNNWYEITFPDGRKFKAKGLGRIPSNDAAMLQINEPGTWPYAEMGWSSSITVDMPCISIAYPGSLTVKTPTIRMGYVAEAITNEGFIRSTCLMEPGDSGGPVFDMKGRVIGLHSKINVSLDDNFEIPVDLYRKYWAALTIPLSYTKLPVAEQFVADLQASALKPVPEIKNMANVLKKLEAKLDYNSLIIKSQVDGIETSINGTLVNLQGFGTDDRIKNKSFLLSKSSMIGETVWVQLKPGKTVPAKVISRDESNDLVLLEINVKLKGGIALASVSTDSVQPAQLGKFLISPQVEQDGIISVLGNTQFAIARGPNPAFIGINTNEKDGKIIISMVQPRSPASIAALETGDEITSFNGKKLFKTEDLSKEMTHYKINDTLKLELNRSGVPYSKQVVLKARRLNERHIAYQFTDGRSERRDGFNQVLVHDARLKPAACGGPLYDIEGNFYGINIARLSRTSTLALPVSVLNKFVREAFLKTNLQSMLSSI
jgi:serine protease Do